MKIPKFITYYLSFLLVLLFFLSKQGFFDPYTTTRDNRQSWHCLLTQLHKAIEHDDGNSILRLLAKGISINSYEEGKRTPLFHAVEKRSPSPSIIKLLIQEGADVSKGAFVPTGYRGHSSIHRTPLEQAITKTRTDLIFGQILYEIPKKNIEILHILAHAHYSLKKEISAWQLSYLKDRCSICYDEPTEKLFEAILKNNDHKEIETIIGKGAYVNAQHLNHKMQTPLMLAVAHNNCGTVTLLLQLGANVNARDNAENTALMLTQDPAIIKILLNADAYVNAMNNSGHTALMLSAMTDNCKKAKLLLKAGARPNLCDKAGKTALMYATQYCDLKNSRIIKLLLNAGGKARQTDIFGKTARMIAEERIKK